jgi:predicted secreted protein
MPIDTTLAVLLDIILTVSNPASTNPNMPNHNDGVRASDVKTTQTYARKDKETNTIQITKPSEATPAQKIPNK